MAALYILEGGERGSSPPRRYLNNMRLAPVPGIVYGDPMQELLGRSLFKKIKNVGKGVARVATSPVRMTYTVTKATGKAVVTAAKKPTLKNISNIVVKPVVRATGETKTTARAGAHAVAEAGRATAMSANVIRRMAKRAIKKVAKAVLFKGDLLGSVAAVSKNAARGILIPPATAAVAANPTLAPAAPVVPVLVNEVIDELYANIESRVKKGLSPEKAASEARADLDKLEPGEENDPGAKSMMAPIFLGLGVLMGLAILARRNH